MRVGSLNLSLVASCFIHGAVIILASIILKHTVSRQDFLPISLVDVPRQDEPKLIRKIETPPEIKKPPPPPKVEKAKEPKPAAKSEIVQPKPIPPAVLPKEEPAKPVETKPLESTKSDPPPEATIARIEGGGSEAGAGNLFGNGDAALVPGSGTAGGGGGTASSGLGRGSGTPGLSAPTTPLRPPGRLSRLKPSVLSTRR